MTGKGQRTVLADPDDLFDMTLDSLEGLVVKYFTHEIPIEQLILSVASALKQMHDIYTGIEGVENVEEFVMRMIDPRYGVRSAQEWPEPPLRKSYSSVSAD